MAKWLRFDDRGPFGSGTRDELLDHGWKTLTSHVQAEQVPSEVGDAAIRWRIVHLLIK